jgi:hypothetical protein
MFETLYSNASTKTTSSVKGDSFGNLFTTPAPKTPIKTTAKKPQTINVPEQSLFQKVTKSPVIGQVLNVAKEFVKQTAIDLKEVFTLPFKQVIAAIKPKTEADKKELKAIYESKLSLEEKSNRATKILEKYGGATEKEFESAGRGAEFGMTFTKAGGAIPEMGAVEGNLKYIFKQGLNKLTGKGEAITKIVGKESNPQEVINTVFKSGIEKTPDGKGIIKTVLEAKKKNVNVVIEKPKPKVAQPTTQRAGLYDTKAEKFVKNRNPNLKSLSIFEDKNSIVLENIESKIKNKGVGTKAMQDLFEYADVKNKRIDLIPGNAKADNFFGKRGFREAKTTNGLVLTRNPRVAQPTLSEVKPITKPAVGTPKPIVKTKAKTLPPEKMGKTPSKIAVSIERKAIEDKLTKGFEGVAGYDKITIKEQSKIMSDLINSGVDNARAVVRGEKPLPKGGRGTALITAMEDVILKTKDQNLRAKLSYELANSPLVSETSAAAQELRLAAERQADSLTAKLREVKQAREEAFKKRFGDKKIAEVQKKVVIDIKNKVKKPDKYDWSNFLNSITC